MPGAEQVICVNGGQHGLLCVLMALLKPGWEKQYYDRPALEPVVCVGKILTHEKLPDGKYNFLLQGIARAKVVAEDRSRVYRVGRLERQRPWPDGKETVRT